MRTWTNCTESASHTWAVSMLGKHAVVGRRVADAGCGTNWARNLLLAQGGTVVGFDRCLGAASVAYAFGRLPFQVGDVETCRLEGFDVAVCIDALHEFNLPWRWLAALDVRVKTLALVVPTSKTARPGTLHAIQPEELRARLRGNGWKIEEDEATEWDLRVYAERE